MQIVIDIPEEIYKRTKLDYEYDVRRITNYEKIIANGTPLPKWHGRIIDESKINTVFFDEIPSKVIHDIKTFPRTYVTGTDAPTIIEEYLQK